MGRGQNFNINRKLLEVDASPPGCLWRAQDFSREVTADMVGIARAVELEVEPEDGTELPQSHDKNLTREKLFLTGE